MAACRAVSVRAEANAVAGIDTDQSGVVFHVVLRIWLRPVPTVPLHHFVTCTDAVRLSRTNIRTDLPRHLCAPRSPRRTFLLCMGLVVVKYFMQCS